MNLELTTGGADVGKNFHGIGHPKVKLQTNLLGTNHTHAMLWSRDPDKQNRLWRLLMRVSPIR
jgi:hypothetical protein